MRSDPLFCSDRVFVFVFEKLLFSNVRTSLIINILNIGIKLIENTDNSEDKTKTTNRSDSF